MVVELQTSWMNMHSGVNERLGRVENLSAFYLVRIVKGFVNFTLRIMGSRYFTRIPFLIW